MRKGDLVKLRPDDPEIARILEWGKKNRSYVASRPATKEEQQAWRDKKRADIEAAHAAGEDTFSLAFNDSGESRLPPRSTSLSPD